jgi:hypothetical protein
LPAEGSDLCRKGNPDDGKPSLPAGNCIGLPSFPFLSPAPPWHTDRAPTAEKPNICCVPFPKHPSPTSTKNEVSRRIERKVPNHGADPSVRASSALAQQKAGGFPNKKNVWLTTRRIAETECCLYKKKRKSPNVKYLCVFVGRDSPLRTSGPGLGVIADRLFLCRGGGRGHACRHQSVSQMDIHRSRDLKVELASANYPAVGTCAADPHRKDTHSRAIRGPNHAGSSRSSA